MWQLISSLRIHTDFHSGVFFVWTHRCCRWRSRQKPRHFQLLKSFQLSVWFQKQKKSKKSNQMALKQQSVCPEDFKSTCVLFILWIFINWSHWKGHSMEAGVCKGISQTSFTGLTIVSSVLCTSIVTLNQWGAPGQTMLSSIRKAIKPNKMSGKFTVPRKRRQLLADYWLRWWKRCTGSVTQWPLSVRDAWSLWKRDEFWTWTRPLLAIIRPSSNKGFIKRNNNGCQSPDHFILTQQRPSSFGSSPSGDQNCL